MNVMSMYSKTCIRQALSYEIPKKIQEINFRVRDRTLKTIRDSTKRQMTKL